MGLRIQQSETYKGDDWWSWSVWIDGTPDELQEIKFVEYTLHPTFKNPVRKVRTRANKFKLSSAGWGVFPVYVRVAKKDGKVRELVHHLRLHYPDGTANNA